jgi:ferredoxin
VKIRVDPDKCQGHTLCAMVAPALFSLDDIDGHASAVSEQVPPGQESDATAAAKTCPEQAVVVH